MTRWQLFVAWLLRARCRLLRHRWTGEHEDYRDGVFLRCDRCRSWIFREWGA